MAGTLLPYVCRYLHQRRTAGEITRTTATSNWAALNTLDEAHGKRPLESLGKGTLTRWKQLRSHLKPSTQCSQWSNVSCFLQWMVAEGHIRANPCRTMKAPKRPRSTPRAFEENDVAATLRHAPDARGRAIVWLMVGMGLRCVEVHRLSIEDWQRRDRIMRVTGKGMHERDVPVPHEAAYALDAYLVQHPATSGPFIRDYRHGQPLKPGTLSHYVTAWMYEAGVKHHPYDGRSAHALRHTAASDVLDNCDDLRVVQQMLGHQHLSSTSVYLRRAAVRKMLDAMEGRSYTAS